MRIKCPRCTREIYFDVEKDKIVDAPWTPTFIDDYQIKQYANKYKGTDKDWMFQVAMQDYMTGVFYRMGRGE